MKITGKQHFWSIFFNKVSDFSPATLFKKENPTPIFFADFYEVFKNEHIFTELLLIVVTNELYVAKMYLYYIDNKQA